MGDTAHPALRQQIQLMLSPDLQLARLSLILTPVSVLSVSPREHDRQPVGLVSHVHEHTVGQEGGGKASGLICWV